MSVMDISGLDAEFAPTRWRAPDLILTVNEDEEEIFLPLDGRFVNLPTLQVEPDLPAPFRDPNPPLQDRGFFSSTFNFSLTIFSYFTMSRDLS